MSKELKSTSNPHLFYDDENHLCLEEKGNKVYVDFTAGKTEHRRKFGGGLGQAIAKAIGITSKYKPYIIDATAGFGKDAFVLASLGCKVLMLERSRIAAQLLQDGLTRSLKSKKTREITERMRLIEVDSIEYLKKLSPTETPDVIYLDPMFPTSKKSRLVKKEMQVFQKIIGDDSDADQLLQTALKVAKKRVVVKRPRKSNPLDNEKPSHSHIGRTSRFDVYIINK
jgi:16S rRNA (guanine1516-N2)-methyltransferase